MMPPLHPFNSTEYQFNPVEYQLLLDAFNPLSDYDSERVGDIFVHERLRQAATSERRKRGVSFFYGEEGFGKTTLCYRIHKHLWSNKVLAVIIKQTDISQQDDRVHAALTPCDWFHIILGKVLDQLRNTFDTLHHCWGTEKADKKNVGFVALQLLRWPEHDLMGRWSSTIIERAHHHRQISLEDWQRDGNFEKLFQSLRTLVVKVAGFKKVCVLIDVEDITPCYSLLQCWRKLNRLGYAFNAFLLPSCEHKLKGEEWRPKGYKPLSIEWNNDTLQALISQRFFSLEKFSKDNHDIKKISDLCDKLDGTGWRRALVDARLLEMSNGSPRHLLYIINSLLEKNRLMYLEIPENHKKRVGYITPKILDDILSPPGENVE